MSAESFLDTNILVYMFDEDDPAKRDRASEMFRAALEHRSACISFQVVQEFSNISTKKFRQKIKIDDLRWFLAEYLMPICVIFPSFALYDSALRLHARYKYSFYDSLIIAAALEAGCSTLFSEDLHDGHTIDRLTIKNPFSN